MEHVTDWSGIWHDFDVVDVCKRRRRHKEKERRKVPPELVGPKTGQLEPGREQLESRPPRTLRTRNAKGHAKRASLPFAVG